MDDRVGTGLLWGRSRSLGSHPNSQGPCCSFYSWSRDAEPGSLQKLASYPATWVPGQAAGWETLATAVEPPARGITVPGQRVAVTSFPWPLGRSLLLGME